MAKYKKIVTNPIRYKTFFKEKAQKTRKSLKSRRYFALSKLNRLEKIAGRKKPKQCEICGAFGKICFDHNHQYDKFNPKSFRGWICYRCNNALGMVNDRVEILKLLIEYLEK